MQDRLLYTDFNHLYLPFWKMNKDLFKDAFLQRKKSQLFYSTRQTKVKETLEAGSLLKSNKGLNILSIGAGDGTLDQCIIKGNQLKVDLYHAIDPVLSKFYSNFVEKVKSWDIPYVVEQKAFSEDYDLPPKNEITVNQLNGLIQPFCDFFGNDDNSGQNIFDLVIMSSMLYHVDHPGLAVKKARSLLKPGGVIIIFIQTLEINSEVYSYMVETSPPEFKEATHNYAMCDQDVMKELDDMKIPYTHDVYDDVGHCHDVTEYLASKGQSPAMMFRMCLEFQAQKKFDDWSEEQKMGVYEIVKRRAFQNGEGKDLAPDYLATIVVKAEDER